MLGIVWLAGAALGMRRAYAAAAWALLADAHPGVHLVLAGPTNPAREQLFAGSPRVHHLGRLPDAVMPGLVAGARAVVVPSLVEGFATIDDGEIWLRNVHIPEYRFGTWTNHAPKRTRKLLLHRKEIDKLERETSNSGRTLVPVSIYFSDGYAKVEIAVATGKKDWDKRQTIAERDANREAQRALAVRNRSRR